MKFLIVAWEQFLSVLNDDEIDGEDKALYLICFYAITAVFGMITLAMTFGFIKGLVRLIVSAFGVEV